MAIKFKNVSYEDILKDVSFEIDMKKVNTIIGPLGSGKSILVQLLCMIKKTTSGKIIVEDDLKIGLVSQLSEEQFFCETVKEELEYNLESFNYSEQRKQKKILDALKMVMLDNSYLELDPLRLSSSEMKKLSLAKALIINPNLLILDEPTNSLDDVAKQNLIKVINTIKRKYNKTIIIVTQDIEFAHLISDKITVINNGKVIVSGDKYKVFSNTKILQKNNIAVPKIIEFENLVINLKNIKLGYRDDINDLIKDILREKNK